MKQDIVPLAVGYLGFRETPNNSGFIDKEFEDRLEDVGWRKSLAWCSYFAELVWKEAYQDNPDMVKLFDKLFSGSATATLKNFDLDPMFTCDMIPEVGALAIYRHGNSWMGHVGIVERVGEVNVINIEGNTNSAGGREGVEVARKTRKIKGKYLARGLNCIGFIHPV